MPCGKRIDGTTTGGGGIDHPAKRRLKDTFFRNEESWRAKVLIRGQELLGQVLELAFES